VTLTARTPRDVLRAFQDHLNVILNKTLTRYRLEFFPRLAKGNRAPLAFFNRRGVATAIPLAPTHWHLSVIYQLRAIPVGGEYGLGILAYEHRIHRNSSIDDEAEVRFEYVSPDIDPGFPYGRHHVQFHQDYHGVREGFSPQKLHIPTGGITIEHVIRFLIADLGVPPLTDRWQEELWESARVTRAWSSDAE
jgi:hypothetical protein